MQQIVKGGIAGGCSLFAYFFGGWSILLTTFLILNILDFILGILASDEVISSDRLTKGGTKKMIMWMWIGIANLLYMVLQNQGYDLGVSIANWVTLYYILTELISLEENSEKLGSPIPMPISFAVNKLKFLMDEKFGQQKDDKK